MSKGSDVISLMKSKAYIYIDGKTATFWGDFKNEEVTGTWHTLLSIKNDLQRQMERFETAYFSPPADKPKKRGRSLKK